MTFELNANFVANYSKLDPPFGFAGLGKLVYKRTYSRKLDDGSDEEWWQTVRRVVNGCFRMQERWIKGECRTWSDSKAQRSAMEMYDRIFNMKFLPPGRGLWAMGTAITEERGLFASLNNCAFVSTKDLDVDPIGPFEFLMDASMLGVGVGFDTEGAGKLSVLLRNTFANPVTFVVDDSREGWVASLRALLESWFLTRVPVEFDYSLLREKGEKLKTFGGVSSGPDPLKELHRRIDEVMGENKGQLVSSTLITDIMNLVGKCVVAGGVRRTSEIAFGKADDDAFLHLKDYELNPSRVAHGWTSNNSVLADLGMDYSKIADMIRVNGEPGLVWLENMRDYGRMCELPNGRDIRVAGNGSVAI